MENNLLCEWFKAIIFLSYLWINSILTQMLLGSWTRKTSCLVTLFNTSSKIWKLTLSEGSIINEILLEIFQTFNACIASPLTLLSLTDTYLDIISNQRKMYFGIRITGNIWNSMRKVTKCYLLGLKTVHGA